MTTGLLDSAALGNCFIRIFNHKEEANQLLERYARLRRDAWINFTNPQSIEFKLRVHSFKPEAERARLDFFDALNNDPSINLKIATMMNQVVEDDFALAEDAPKDTIPTEGQDVVGSEVGKEDALAA